MSRRGRFVPDSVIRDRMDRKDLRYQSGLGQLLTAEFQAPLPGLPVRRVPVVVEVAIVPASPEAAPGPVVEVVLVPATRTPEVSR